MFLQSLTEWVFRHVPLYYVFHIMLGVLMSLYYVKTQNSKAEIRKKAEERNPKESYVVDTQTPLPAAIPSAVFRSSDFGPRIC
jgi:hypothetical protein